MKVVLMLARWFFAPALLCCFLMPLPALAAGMDLTTSALYQSLTFNAAKGDMTTLLATIDKAMNDKKNDFPTLSTLQTWLTDNTYGQLDDQKVFSQYFLKLYDVDGQIGQFYKQQKGEQSTAYRQATLDSFKALLTYELMAMADAGRCQDSSVIGVVANNLGPRYQNINYAYKLLNQNEVSLAWYSAMQYEEQKADRPFNIYLCLKGDKARQNPLQYNPVNVSPSAWTEIRSDIRSKYTDYWKNRYAEALKAPAVRGNAP
jgi:hypothetical protein